MMAASYSYPRKIGSNSGSFSSLDSHPSGRPRDQAEHLFIPATSMELKMANSAGPFHRNFASAPLRTGMLILGTATALIISITAQSASAAIRCDGNFQITEHGPIATPYCQDNYLAQIALEYGMRVSGEAVRYNVGVKKRVCRLVGYDIRIKDTCVDYLPEGDRRLK
jgi:hypothetical protein